MSTTTELRKYVCVCVVMGGDRWGGWWMSGRGYGLVLSPPIHARKQAPYIFCVVRESHISIQKEVSQSLVLFTSQIVVM